MKRDLRPCSLLEARDPKDSHAAKNEAKMRSEITEYYTFARHAVGNYELFGPESLDF